MVEFRPSGRCWLTAFVAAVLVIVLSQQPCQGQPGIGSPVANLIRARVPHYQLWVAIQQDVLRFMPTCNNLARQFWRALFHDAGTYNIAFNTGGTDGSLQFELERDENRWAAPAIQVLKFIIEQRTYLDGTTVEPFTPFQPSMADLLVLAGKLALARCSGPNTTFVPGRKDASVENGAGLLPGPNDSVDMLVASAQRMGLTLPQFATLVAAGHTFADAEHHGLDSTPRIYDTAYHKELLAHTAPETLKSDENMLLNLEMKAAIQRHATDPAAFAKETMEVLELMSNFGQGCATVLPPAAQVVAEQAATLEVGQAGVRALDWSLFVAAKSDSCFEPSGFGLIQGRDISTGNITLLPGAVLSLADYCTTNLNCKSFNTDGWTKSQSIANANLNTYADVCEGLIAKKTPLVPPPGSLTFTIATGVATNVRKCINVENGKMDAWTAVQQADCISGGFAQQWMTREVASGVYNVMYGSMCLDVAFSAKDNANLMLYVCTAADNQKFMFRPLPAAVGGFQMVPMHAQDFCLTVTGDNPLATVQLRLKKCLLDSQDKNTIVTQQFNWEVNAMLMPPPTTPTEVHTGTMPNMCLHVLNNNLIDGADVVQSGCTGSVSQKFTFKSTGDGYFNIMIGSNLCVSLAAKATTIGTAIKLNTCVAGQDSQKWVFRSSGVTTPWYHLAPKSTLTSCMEVSGGSTLNDARVQIWDCGNYNHHKWMWLTAPIIPPTSGPVEVRTGTTANMCMNVATISDASEVLQSTCNGGAGQKFIYQDMGDGSVTITITHPTTGAKFCAIAPISPFSGSRIKLAACTGQNNQKWLVNPHVASPNGWYNFVAKHAPRMCLDVFAASTFTNQPITIADCWGYENQRFLWQTAAVLPPLYTPLELRTFTSTTSNMCLQVLNNNFVAGAAVQQFTCNGAVGQQFSFESAGDGYVNMVIKGFCVAAPGTTIGTTLQLASCTGNDNHKWSFSPNTAYTSGYSVVPKHMPSKCMDVFAGMSSNGVNLHIWDCNKTPAQRFIWSTVTGSSKAGGASIKEQREALFKSILEDVLANPTPIPSKDDPLLQQQLPTDTTITTQQKSTGDLQDILSSLEQDASTSSDMSHHEGKSSLTPVHIIVMTAGIVAGMAALAGISVLVVRRRRRTAVTVTPVVKLVDDDLASVSTSGSSVVIAARSRAPAFN